MELTKSYWSKEDIAPMQDYLRSLGRGAEKAEWEKRIVNTELPCLAITSTDLAKIVKEIAKGNFISYIDLWIWEYHQNTVIIGGLIPKITDFELQKKYLTEYASRADSWATIDTLKFNFTKKTDKRAYVEFAKELVKSPKTYVRRLGLIILLKLASYDEFVEDTLGVIDSLTDEKEYYVNMANAWLVAEMFTRHRDRTLEYINNNNLNKFTINKAISKCRDSYRISADDKELLVQFRRK